ncbi:PQQ-dependent sugar dehydrogenase [Zhihengliuella sp.]|uniref:PQQ-dependent sugar dehydrogenase n=1 Tax=Zhihengliuella sp. TaxID=1954483 RepID=UPI002811821F|nr:PQQ-dependent sugar dehydrogenase [Zhihengliuella sp.]
MRTRATARGSRAVLVPALVVAAVAGCTGATDPAAERSASPTSEGPASGPSGLEAEPSELDVSTVASGLDAPWSIAFHGDTPLLSERDTGRILELAEDGAAREIGAIAEAAPRGEGGLLGIAVREDYLYAYFTAPDENRIQRYPLTGEPGALGLGEPEPLLGGADGLDGFDAPDAASYHNGGRIVFGPDGMLYATVGDAGDAASAQDREDLNGTILRLTPDGGVPEDNPFEGSPVYSYGHRNPQGLAWDEEGTLYSSEFGQNTWDELNVIEPGGNYGWPEVEGVGGDDRFIDPVQQWSPADASPSGMAIVGGGLWIANLRGERLREVPLEQLPQEDETQEDLDAATEHLVGEHGRLRDAARAPDGSLWVLTNNTDGRGTPGPDDDRLLRVERTP